MKCLLIMSVLFTFLLKLVYKVICLLHLTSALVNVTFTFFLHTLNSSIWKIIKFYYNHFILNVMCLTWTDTKWNIAELKRIKHVSKCSPSFILDIIDIYNVCQYQIKIFCSNNSNNSFSFTSAIACLCVL